MPTSLIDHLARWSLAPDVRDLPPAALAQAKLLLLDTIGCGLAARDEALAHAFDGLGTVLGGAGPCTLIGRGVRSTAPHAVLANGTLVRMLDLNDYVVRAGRLDGHPSDNIPVALAAAEAYGRSGPDMLAAIVLGYDVFGWAKAMMGESGPWDGVSVSGLAVPAMFGRLMGLDAEALAHALALGTAHAATSAAVRAGAISSAKSLANAVVAQHGVEACLLAAAGVTGPTDIFEQARGARALFPEAADGADRLAAMSPGAYVLTAQIKAYPCLATGQSAVAAGLALHREVPAVERIVRVELTMSDYPIVRRQQADAERRDPRSREAADHSFPFLAAVSLMDGAFGPAQFEGERWADPAVRALMSRIEMGVDAGLNPRAGGYPCAMRVWDADGREFSVEILDPPGYSAGRLDEGAVVAKFHAATRDIIGDASRARLVETVMDLERQESCAALWQLLAAAA